MIKPRGIYLTLGILGAFSILALAARCFLRPEPVYQGKSVKVWFHEYRQLPGWPAAYSTFGPADRELFDSGGKKLPDPALDALRGMGSNAVPYLTERIHVGLFDHFYTPFYTNLPLVVRRRLPDPWSRTLDRQFAVVALAGLRDQAHKH